MLSMAAQSAVSTAQATFQHLSALFRQVVDTSLLGYGESSPSPDWISGLPQELQTMIFKELPWGERTKCLLRSSIIDHHFAPSVFKTLLIDEERLLVLSNLFPSAPNPKSVPHNCIKWNNVLHNKDGKPLDWDTMDEIFQERTDLLKWSLIDTETVSDAANTFIQAIETHSKCLDIPSAIAVLDQQSISPLYAFSLAFVSCVIPAKNAKIFSKFEEVVLGEDFLKHTAKKGDMIGFLKSTCAPKTVKATLPNFVYSSDGTTGNLGETNESFSNVDDEKEMAEAASWNVRDLYKEFRSADWEINVPNASWHHVLANHSQESTEDEHGVRSFRYQSSTGNYMGIDAFIYAVKKHVSAGGGQKWKFINPELACAAPGASSEEMKSIRIKIQEGLWELDEHGFEVSSGGEQGEIIQLFKGS